MFVCGTLYIVFYQIVLGAEHIFDLEHRAFTVADSVDLQVGRTSGKSAGTDVDNDRVIDLVQKLLD